MKPHRLFKATRSAVLATAVVWTLSGLGPQGAAASADPTPASHDAASPAARPVERLHAKLLEAMKNADELGYQGRFDLLRPTLQDCFDLDFMASKSVGRGWRSLDDEQKKLWMTAFGRLLTANFAGRFEGWTGQSFETLGEEPAARETVLVLTKIADPNEEDIQLNYRMKERDGRWWIVDVYFNGTVSELAMRRSEYSSMLKREGFDELLAAVDARVTDLASGKVE